MKFMILRVSFPAIRTCAVIFHAVILHFKTHVFFYPFGVKRCSGLKILNLSAPAANEVDVWFQIGFMAVIHCVEIYYLDNANFNEGFQCIVNSGKTQSGTVFFCFLKHYARAGMRIR